MAGAIGVFSGEDDADFTAIAAVALERNASRGAAESIGSGRGAPGGV